MVICESIVTFKNGTTQTFLSNEFATGDGLLRLFWKDDQGNYIRIKIISLLDVDEINVNYLRGEAV